MSTPDQHERVAIAAIFERFREIFPASLLTGAERSYLSAMFLRHVTEILAGAEDDHR